MIKASRALFVAAYFLVALCVSASAQIAGIDFYVSPTGLDTNDCATPATACAHFSHVALKAAEAGPQPGGMQHIHPAPGGYNEGINFNANTNIVYIDGPGSSLVFLNNLPGGCGTIIANTGANIGLNGLSISGVADPCTNTIYAQLGGVINLGNDVVLGAAYGALLHCEGPGSQIQVWSMLTVKGGGAGNFAAATSSCQVSFNPVPGVGVTFNPTQSFPGGVLFSMVNGSVYIPANMTWVGAVNGPKWVASTNSTIWTDGVGCASLPGNLPGVPSSNGICQ